MRKTTQERFECKYEVPIGTGCWLWTACLDKDGYGFFSDGVRQRHAHRFAYEFFVGPIQPGLQLDHLCRQPRCVNPAHLEPVTGRENLLRGNTFQARNAAKKHCYNGHPFDDVNTYVERSADGRKRRCRICAKVRSDRYRARLKSIAR